MLAESIGVSCAAETIQKHLGNISIMRSLVYFDMRVWLSVFGALLVSGSPAVAGVLGNAGSPLKQDLATGTGLASGKGVYGPPSPKTVSTDLANASWQDPPSEVSQVLLDVVRSTSASHPAARAAQAQFRAATSDVSAAQWQRFPTLSTQLSYGNLSQQSQSYSIAPTVTVDMPLWAGGKIDATLNRTRAQQWAAFMALNETLQVLALNVSQTYFDILRLSRRESLLGESIREHEQLVETMERRVRQEVSPFSDLELAQSRLAQIRQEADIMRAQRLASQRFFIELAGNEAFDFTSFPSAPPEVVAYEWSGVENEALAYDPSLRRQSALADVAKAEGDMTKASIFPQVSAQYSRNDLFGSRVGLVVKLQSVGGLSQFSAVESARLRLEGAIDQIAGVQRQVRQQVSNDVIENDAALARLKNSSVAAATAGRIKDSYMRQFISGRRSWLDVMNSLRESVNAQLNEVDAIVSASASAVRIAIRTGAWRPFKDPSSE